MKKTHLSNRILSVLLALAMLLSFAAPISAADQRAGVRFEEVDNSMVSGNVLTELKEDETSAPQYSDTDMVRVSIFLNKKSTLKRAIPP